MQTCALGMFMYVRVRIWDYRGICDGAFCDISQRFAGYLNALLMFMCISLFSCASHCKFISLNSCVKYILLYYFTESWFTTLQRMVLSKPRNDLKRPETTYSEQETTCHFEQRVRQPTPQQLPEPTNNKQKKTRSDQKQADFEIILQYDSIGSLLSHVFHHV